ncbi:hypothetical protein [Pseudonocardia sp. N23]|uniref:hypothetical protein n=1 Tax=Pseudonocardia sp. N23 TaxID=1987376 RepID=UPI000C033612|nr:hypothetical protein [Pseudonocardia sp. N23]GAY12592.1 hypothetical protein TOK_1080 [Pseudonocardia sp. N23]
MSDFLTELSPPLAALIFLGIPLVACTAITAVVVWRVRRDHRLRGVPLPRDEDDVTEPILGPATDGGGR